jgi:hypothetical protein
MTSLWGGHGLINVLPSIALSSGNEFAVIGAIVGGGLLGVVLTITQMFLLRSWPRRLFSLAIGCLLLWNALLALHHGLVGDPRLSPIFAMTLFLAVAASLLVIWKPRMWVVMAAACAGLMLIVPPIVERLMRLGEIPRTVLAGGDLVYMDTLWFGEEESPVIGAMVMKMQLANADGSKPPEYFQIIGDSVVTVDLPTALWVPSRSWDGKIALGSTINLGASSEDERETQVRIFDADGSVRSVEEIPPSSASVAAMIAGWTFGSDESPWLLIPVTQLAVESAYDPQLHAIHARHAETGETHLLEGLTTMLFAQWEDPDTMIIARLTPLVVEIQEDEESEDSIEPGMDPLEAFTYDEESGEFTWDPEDFEAFFASMSGEATPKKPHQAELLRVHVPSDTREVIAEGMIDDLSRVMHVSGDDYLVFLTEATGDIGILSWAKGEVEFPTPTLIYGSLSVAETARGFRMVYQEHHDEDSSAFHMHDGREIIHSTLLPWDSKIQGAQISPDGGKVLFRRDAAPSEYEHPFPSLSVEIWDVDRDEVTVLARRPAVISILESISVLSFFHWHRNPWRPDGRSVAVPMMGFRWPPNANITSDLTLFHYEDWAEKKWGVRPTQEAEAHDSN